MKSKLTNEDIWSLRYFWTEKRDLTRWSGWEDNLALIQAEFPELLKAWNDLRYAQKIMDLVVGSLPTIDE